MSDNNELIDALDRLTQAILLAVSAIPQPRKPGRPRKTVTAVTVVQPVEPEPAPADPDRVEIEVELEAMPHEVAPEFTDEELVDEAPDFLEEEVEQPAQEPVKIWSTEEVRQAFFRFLEVESVDTKTYRRSVLASIQSRFNAKRFQDLNPVDYPAIMAILHIEESK